MAINRMWLDWSKPCLPRAAAWLCDSVESSQLSGISFDDRICDLRDVICVLPGRRAGRLLLAQLIQRCEVRQARLIPPRVLTPGSMVDHVLGLDAPGAVADEFEIALTWMQALQRMDDDAIGALLPHRPDTTDTMAWLDLAKSIAQLHAELAGQKVNFTNAADFAEGRRWRALANAHREYLLTLSQHGLTDPHEARRDRLRSFAEVIQNNHIRLALIGVVDLNAQQRAVASALGSRAIALIHAPESLADRFDELGCVIPGQWTDGSIDIDDDQIRVGDRPADQAQHALRAIAELRGEFAAGEITIGLGDEGMVPTLQRAAEWAGVKVRSAAGKPLRQSSPYRWLDAAATWLGDQRFATFAAILRHPDLERWILNCSDIANPKSKIQDPTSISSWLTLLDQYFADHLHERITGDWLGNDDQRRALASVYDAVNRLLAPLRVPRDAKKSSITSRPLRDWCQPILDVLASLYGTIDSSLDDRNQAEAIEACRSLRDVLANVAAIPEHLQPRVDAAGAIQLVLEQAAKSPVVEPKDENQIEMLGWLELHLDTAPVLIVTGFNDGHIPGASTMDAFLPDSLRAALGLDHNARRYARDAYMLQAIQRSRSRLTIIAGRRSAQGDPLTPSRFLLACDGETLVRRVNMMCGEGADHVALWPIGAPQPVSLAQSRFERPAIPGSFTIPETLRVTDFAKYLACPFRFALDRVVELKGFNDDALEMDPLQFGSLAHEVLCAFGKNKDASLSADAKLIERFLLDQLDKEVPKRFGKHPVPAVRVQIARLQQRLRSFAKFQSEHRKDGWRIEHCELAFTGEIELDIPGQPSMPLHGKIDRIDVHEESGDWLIIDYKTGEVGESPHKTHNERETLKDDAAIEWTDLQLPLYRHLATARNDLKIAGNIRLGYIILPKKSDGAELKEAHWTQQHLAEAITKARQVVQGIRARQFDINKDFFSPFDEFARICQSTTFSEDEEEEGEE